MTAEIMWTPSERRVATSEIVRFGSYLGKGAGRPVANGDDLAALALADPEEFWSALWDFYGVLGDKGEAPFMTVDDMIGTRFFPGARLNFAENLMGLGEDRDPGATALVFHCENKVRLRWTWGDLQTHVSRLQQALAHAGVGPGDRVAGLLPNRPEAVAAMLAAVSLGATWCSASPDFGARAVLDRFAQIEPKVLFATDGYWYAGKRFEIGQKLGAIVQQLPSVNRTVVIDYLGTAQETADDLHNGVTFAAFESAVAAGPLEFNRLPFDHPLFVLFSSGTTGAPKCIVHRAGGVLLQHLKEHALHADVQPGNRLFFFTTLGWMMWNWLVSGLARGATLLLFDGSPFHPGPEVLFDYASDERMTHFGTSAKYIDSLRKAEFRPDAQHNLSALRTMLSTGSPLLGDGFDYVYDAIKADLHLASISGGTDIVSCFVTGDPTAPVHRGEIQRPGFGLAIDVWRDDGTPADDGEKGELVCTAPFPSMPLGFWGDDDGSRYCSAYFERFPGVWCQGDFAERRATGGFVIHGRSDATLNPGGVRIGTAEIYAEVEKFAEVREAVVIGQDTGDDVRVVLFVTLILGKELTEALVKEIKTAIRQGSSPRHVPALILAVDDIPRTKSGKISELAVRDVVHGRSVKSTDSLANPEALDCFRDLVELRL
ncbi:acetoacetate--CoA ligase [uncultured Paracoccus sp.]|uniref:acetoacetate--CoA ligase n=1 Tax=uncultured Paracoccus sp. TaxID=189685 RepID=UPI002608D1A8|nr:acetoacetate--CoA ligase [uncultured Paracoccus sp.]HMQ12587.1 acetoacetate--CoA ligase [Candidatus Competibacter phosphatis]